MKIANVPGRFLPLLVAVLLLALILPGKALAGPDATLVAGMGPDEALRMGERMYREGILPSGEPMQALVKGDIPVDGRAFTCVSCHLRSGIGVLEGQVLSAPITGAKLYAPLARIDRVMFPSRKDYISASVSEPLRPAYTDETLTRVLRTGEDAAGKQIGDVMPKYFLSDRDAAVLVHYLRQLSTGPEPGVDGRTLRLATIIAGEVPEKEREAMVAPLRAYVQRWNVVQPAKARGVRQEPFVHPMSKRYGGLALAVWELKGAPETWRAQLEAHQAAEPAFAFLGGISASGWEPIHRFCEEQRIPAFFPLTDLPVVSDQEWYTLYLSKGLYQEGEAAAKFLLARKDVGIGVPVVQIIRDSEAGLAVARGFRETWAGAGNSAPRDIVLTQGEKVTEALWQRIRKERKGAVVLLWDGDADLSLLAKAVARSQGPETVFLSSGLMGERVYSLPEKARKRVYITYPRMLPQEAAASQKALDKWLMQNGLPSIDRNIESRVYSLVTILQNPLTMMMMRDYLFREHLMERVDMMQNEVTNRAVVPEMSFGNGQRYASKGCYIVQLTEGPAPSLTSRSEWIIR